MLERNVSPMSVTPTTLNFISESVVQKIKADLQKVVLDSRTVDEKIQRLSSDQDFLDEAKVKLLEEKIATLRSDLFRFWNEMPLIRNNL